MNSGSLEYSQLFLIVTHDPMNYTDICLKLLHLRSHIPHMYP